MLKDVNKNLLGEYLPLEQLLAEYHKIFSLEEGERGEADWIALF